MPDLSTNLVSIYRLTHDLNCHVIFSSNMCEFQALKTGKMTGTAREQHELYFLCKREAALLEIGCLMLLVPLNSLIILLLTFGWLQHYKLGHPPFLLLKFMFP